MANPDGDEIMVVDRQRTRISLLWLALAALLLGLVGSGLIALTQDVGTFPGNSLESNEFVDSHDVQVASHFAGSCDDVTYDDNGGSLYDFLGPFDVNERRAAGSQVDSDTICVTNAGPASGELVLSLTNVVATDLGCGPGEAAADELGCTNGDPSDIDLRLLLFVETFGTYANKGDSCTSTTAGWYELAEVTDTAVAVVDPDFAPGDVCQYRVTLRYPGETPDNFRARDQTDALAFDVVFTLQDVTP